MCLGNKLKMVEGNCFPFEHTLWSGSEDRIPYYIYCTKITPHMSVHIPSLLRHQQPWYCSNDHRIWFPSYLSTLVQIMACCITATIYYVNHCWFVINNFCCKACKKSSDATIFHNVNKINFRITFPKGFSLLAIVLNKQLSLDRKCWCVDSVRQWHGVSGGVL